MARRRVGAALGPRLAGRDAARRTACSAAEMLEALQLRMPNEPADELRVAAAEQAKITRIRLEKLEL